jgi:hypothetical protein
MAGYVATNHELLSEVDSILVPKPGSLAWLVDATESFATTPSRPWLLTNFNISAANGHTAQDEGVDTRKASYYCWHHGRTP